LMDMVCSLVFVSVFEGMACRIVVSGRGFLCVLSRSPPRGRKGEPRGRAGRKAAGGGAAPAGGRESFPRNSACYLLPVSPRSVRTLFISAYCSLSCFIHASPVA